MKDNHESEHKKAAEQEISRLYRKMATEQPSEELDNTILHLARNKDLLLAETEVKPLTLLERIKARSAPLAMAASVVLVGSVVLLQDWREQLVPKRYGPQSGAYDHVTPQATQAEQTLQSAPAVPTSQTKKERAALRQVEAYQAAEQVNAVDESSLKRQTDGKGQSRFRTQPEVERLLPAADAPSDKARFKSQFSGPGQDAAAKVPEVQGLAAPEQRTGASKSDQRPAKILSLNKEEKLEGEKDSQQPGVKAPSIAFSQQAAKNAPLLEQKRINAWLAEIDQLLAADEHEEVINQLKAFVAANPDYALAEKYQKLLLQLENN